MTEELKIRLDRHSDRLANHGNRIAVLEKQASSTEDDRLRVWRNFDELKDRMNQQHDETMQAISSNKVANAIIQGQRGAGKWIVGLLLTLLMAGFGLYHVAVDIIERIGR